jgi:hypothetical protein
MPCQLPRAREQDRDAQRAFEARVGVKTAEPGSGSRGSDVNGRFEEAWVRIKLDFQGFDADAAAVALSAIASLEAANWSFLAAWRPQKGLTDERSSIRCAAFFGSGLFGRLPGIREAARRNDWKKKCLRSRSWFARAVKR